ncbi:MAG: 50S ribosomal protein L3 N(5)-glutamine methyltransferase [Pseudomonadota bacterium]|nr:50S ribosomal protein L3 N(5)-glutamine methyltransferase [Pseudomonadota bacterium]
MTPVDREWQAPIHELSSLRDFLRWGVSRLFKDAAVFGHGFDDPWDEALAIILYGLNLPWEIDDRVLDARLLEEERRDLVALFRRRLVERIPTAYLTRSAWFAEMEFYVDERVLVPRSPLAELIEGRFQEWIDPSRVERILDLCTGSGCVAMAAAMAFPAAEVVGTDISAPALEVAKINRTRHGLEERVELLEGDLYTPLGAGPFDLILSNPPYVPVAAMAELPAEYRHEPELGLVAGQDGLDIVRRILSGARQWLAPGGLLVVEVGDGQDAVEHAFPDTPFFWPEFMRGGHGVFVLSADQLPE